MGGTECPCASLEADPRDRANPQGAGSSWCFLWLDCPRANRNQAQRGGGASPGRCRARAEQPVSGHVSQAGGGRGQGG